MTFEGYRESRFDNIMIKVKQMASEMGVKVVFKEKCII